MAFIDSGKQFDKDKNHDDMKKRMENLTNVQYTVRIPEDLYKRVKLKLVKENKKLRPVIVKMLEDYIQE